MSAGWPRRLIGGVGYYGIVLLAALAALGPSVWVMVSSFKQGSQIYSGAGFVPDPFTLHGYADAFGEVHLQNYLLNTALYAAGGTLGALTMALLAAYPLARFRFRGSNGLVAAFSLALAIPAVGLATPEFFIVRELGLFNSKLGLTVFYAALLFPLSFVILRAFLVSLPSAIEEAAVMDGAGYFTILWRIVVPLARPALATVAVVAFVNIWNEFFFANLLTSSPENHTVSLAMANFKTTFGFNVSGAMAGTTMVMIVPITMFLLLQRQVIAGLTAGTTK